MSKSLSAVVVGTGFIGPVHVEGLRRAGILVAGIVGSSPEKSEAAANRLGLPDRYRTLQQVLADDKVDSVHITTPNRLHFDQAKSVLAAGKHLLCEKPLAMNSQQSSELVRLAEERQRVAGVAYNVRFYPLCHEAAARIRDGSLGNVLHANGAYVQDWLLYDTDYNWRVEKELGGELRAVADIGTHWLDLVQFVTGLKIVSVCADLHTVHETRRRPVGGAETFTGGSSQRAEVESVAIDTEDCGAVMFRFANGASGSLWVSQTTAGRKNCCRFEIGGARQSLAWNSEQPNSLWIGERDGANQCLLRDPALMTSSAASIANYPGGHNEGFPDTFKQLFRSFYSYIAAGELNSPAPFPTFADGHREILLCEAILKSDRERRWIDLPFKDAT